MSAFSAGKCMPICSRRTELHFSIIDKKPPMATVWSLHWVASLKFPDSKYHRLRFVFRIKKHLLKSTDFCRQLFRVEILDWKQ